MAEATGTIQVITKAVRVMDCFDSRTPVLSAAEIRHRTGFPASTLARLLGTLVHERLLERDGDDYRVGLRALVWSGSALGGSSLLAMAHPVLEQLRDRTGETSGIFVRDGGVRIGVAAVESGQAIAYRGTPGEVKSLHAGAAGKVFMAFDEDAHRQALAMGLERYTENTVIDPDELDQVLAEVRTAGVAVARDERDRGLSSVAAPVRGPGGTIACVMAVGLPTYRLEGREEELCASVVRSAGELSGMLGWTHAEARR